MYFKCCVSNCKSTRNDATLHKFPSNETQRNKWLQCLKDDRLQEESLKNLFVCQKHFERRFVTAKSRLLNAAYPTLFTALEISSGKPEVDTEYVDCQVDHNYSRKRHLAHTYCKDLSLSHEMPDPSEQDIALRKLRTEEPSGSKTEMPDPSEQEIELKKLRTEEPSGSKTAVPESIEQIVISEQQSNENPPSSNNVPAEVLADTSASSTILRIEVREKTPPTGTSNILATTPKSRKTSRQKIIHKLKNLTPTCQRIYKEYTKVKNQADFHKRAKRAVKFSKEQSFENLVKGMNSYSKKFIAMQINLCTEKKKGRRFSLDEKLIALSIMKQSPKCYRFLHKIFILPSTSTLNKMVSRLNIEAGINDQFFKLLKKEVDSWKDSKKYCSILFDEMSLGLGLSYDTKKDKINGFVDLQERKGKFADHVLVFMARGAVHKWQQPVAYYFCEGATSGPELKNILKEVINAISQTGLKPKVLACDQGSAFQSALKSFQEDTRREQLLQNEQPDDTVYIAGNKLHVVFYPSHLIKGIRNNFLTKDIKYEGKTSSWQDIVDVYKTDCNHTQTRLLHKLNDEHVIPEKVKKMKVKNCVRVLSKTMAAALSYTAQFSHYVDGTPVSKTLQNTAETVSFFDDLFDSIIGAASSIHKAQGKALRTAVRENSRHHEFWPEAIKKLEKMKFVDKNGVEKSVPTLILYYAPRG